MHSDENTAIIDHANRLPSASGTFGIADVIDAPVGMYLDSKACREWIIKRLHPDGYYCPGCGKQIPDRALARYYRADRIKCTDCGKFYTAMTGTFLSGCQLEFKNIILLAILLSPVPGDKRIAEILGMSTANVRIWRKKFDAQEKIKNG